MSERWETGDIFSRILPNYDLRCHFPDLPVLLP
jgi:hypothetical protein